MQEVPHKEITMRRAVVKQERVAGVTHIVAGVRSRVPFHSVASPRHGQEFLSCQDQQKINVIHSNYIQIVIKQ